MSHKKVMVVDDDQEFLEELQEMLSLSDYDPLVIYDSTLAFEKACDSKPDAILLDLKMDRMSGYEVARKLKHFPETAKIPIIIMTGYFIDEEHASLLKMPGIKLCLIKPFNPLDIIASLEEVLRVDRNYRFN